MLDIICTVGSYTNDHPIQTPYNNLIFKSIAANVAI
ncbi:hypothetical protein PSGL111025_08765 [Psychrobacter glaciei]|jgi:hypothetical protein